MLKKNQFRLIFPLFTVISVIPITNAAQLVTGTVLPQTLKFLGTQSISAAAGPSATAENGAYIRQELEQDREFEKQITGSMREARVPASHVPTPENLSVSGGSVTGFNGLTHAEQRLADSGNQFSLEPPDQGFAIGNGQIVEAVNLAVRVRPATGQPAGAVISLNKFFGLASARAGSPPVYGPFLSDPKVYYDAVLQRFFLTVLEIDTDPATGDLLGHSSVLIAVTKTSDPAGSWYLYSLDTTDDGTGGTPKHAGCPCLGDQPLIGADANGFYVTTNEFPIFANGFNGAQVYALSKIALASGTLSPVVMFTPGGLAEGPAYSLQPATVAPGGAFEATNGGTEYFMSALDFAGTLDNRIAVWALTGTQTLTSNTPSLTLRSAIVE